MGMKNGLVHNHSACLCNWGKLEALNLISMLIHSLVFVKNFSMGWLILPGMDVEGLCHQDRVGCTIGMENRDDN